MSLTTTEMRNPRSIQSVVSTGPVWRVGAVAGIAAAVATVLFALLAKAIDVPMEIEGDSIPVLGFAMVTLLWTAVGTILAIALDRRAQHPGRIFVVITLALTALSFVPVLTADASTATKVALALAHVIAAAIVIPTLARRLSDARSV